MRCPQAPPSPSNSADQHIVARCSFLQQRNLTRAALYSNAFDRPGRLLGASGTHRPASYSGPRSGIAVFPARANHPFQALQATLGSSFVRGPQKSIESHNGCLRRIRLHHYGITAITMRVDILCRCHQSSVYEARILLTAYNRLVKPSLPILNPTAFSPFGLRPRMPMARHCAPNPQDLGLMSV